MQNISIIRNRGQLTIPDQMRKSVNWASPMSAVLIIMNSPDEIIIKPQQAVVDWEKIWAGIKKARSISGSGGNLSAFIAEDRQNH